MASQQMKKAKEIKAAQQAITTAYDEYKNDHFIILIHIFSKSK
jgi:hypothetical protein